MLLLARMLATAVLGLSSGHTKRVRHTSAAGLVIEQFPCRADNYGYLVHDAASGTTAAVDTPDAAAVMSVCGENNWKLTHILNTHHHNDHVGGNSELKSHYGCAIIGPAADKHRIPGMDRGVSEGETFSLGAHPVHVIDVKGHTTGHIAFHLPKDSLVFVGDSLFVLGCGRLFEGTPAMAWESLQKLAKLPRETVVFCAHEYSQANARFSLTVDPENEALRARAAQIDARRKEGLPTVPTTIGEELETNPFLRPAADTVRAALAMAGKADADVFAEIRARKDRF
mmetsp:Transcript_15132/g.51090  ORF Transcript_15132/g.51090 Transcript_15132/m.51090 type:complete len:284 (-) Transcript_15132:186-1037(-)